MKRWIICFFVLVVHGNLCAQLNLNSQLAELNQTIEASARYDLQKEQVIRTLKQSFDSINHGDLSSRFNLSLSLYEEYKVFHYDSAYRYTTIMQQTATALDDPVRKDLARLKLSFILLSTGLFTEAYDSLQHVQFVDFPDSLKAEYYTLMARYYYDLADYDNDKYHSPAYNVKGNAYVDSALQLFSDSSFAFNYYSGLRLIRDGRREEAAHYFQQLMADSSLTFHELALTASTLSDCHIQNRKTDSAIVLLIKASIADIKSSTKETAAIFNLASLLFKQDDIQRASLYIEKALNDAFSYGARQRKIQVSAILSLIEAEKVNRVEREKRTLITYATVVTLLMIALGALIFIIFRQLRKLKIAQQIITDANKRQQEINHSLHEANKFKDEYIGYFFNGNSEFYAKLEKFKKNLEVKVNDRKLEEIRLLANTINIKKEKEELISNFDRIFLRLFPHFIEEFNSLFAPEDQVHLKENELLNTDLRIFALMRMGIHDSEKIARILEYSVNTINTYKTRIKNKSIVLNESFEERIMEIKSI